VDEAHGAHLTLPPPFPKGALFHGADIVVHSAHKMLPAMTMGSFLHVNSDQIPLDSLEFYLGALQSSSPSYPIMASLDMARFFLASMTAEDVLFTLEEKEKIIHLLQDKGIEVIHSARQDPLKFLLRKKGLSGYELQEELGKVGIYSELADPFQVLCIWPLIKAERYGYSGQVRDRISYLSLPDIQTNEENNIPDEKREKITELALSFQEQEQTEVSWIPIQEAIGRISAEMIIPYPPGIPLLVPGELITTKHLNILKNLMKHHAHIQGIQKQEAAQLAVFSC
ncbi:MAG TPA: hypothetical protein VEY51_05295, partial [Chondromyces sp.]|nr:hypothetical protein [Chondromyces sp.]